MDPVPKWSWLLILPHLKAVSSSRVWVSSGDNDDTWPVGKKVFFQANIKFKLLTSVKIAKIKGMFSFKSSKSFIRLINVAF